MGQHADDALNYWARKHFGEDMIDQGPPKRQRPKMDKRLQFKGNREDAERDARRTVLNAKDMKERLR